MLQYLQHLCYHFNFFCDYNFFFLRFPSFGRLISLLSLIFSAKSVFSHQKAVIISNRWALYVLKQES